MNDWLRSLTLLGMAFAAVVVVTLGLAGAIVPTAGGEAPVEGSSTDPSPAAAARPGVVGGTLVVTGDREGTFALEREITDGAYGLAGDDGRILFEGGDPVTIGQVQYDGLDIFVDPEQCTVTPGERHDPTGVASAAVRCESLTDVRDSGTIRLEGTVGVAADLFGLRGDLPETGGTIDLGDETLTVPTAQLIINPFQGAFVGQLGDRGQSQIAVNIVYDAETHGLGIGEVAFGSDVIPVEGGCSISEREIGVLNPHTRVSELRLECASLDIPSLGTVPLNGTVIAEIVEPPEIRPRFRP